MPLRKKPSHYYPLPMKGEGTEGRISKDFFCQASTSGIYAKSVLPLIVKERIDSTIVDDSNISFYPLSKVKKKNTTYTF